MFLNIFRCFPTCSDVSQHFRSFRTCFFPNLFRLFPTCSYFQTFSDFSPTCSDVPQHFQIFPNPFRFQPSHSGFTQHLQNLPNTFRLYPHPSDFTYPPLPVGTQKVDIGAGGPFWTKQSSSFIIFGLWWSRIWKWPWKIEFQQTSYFMVLVKVRRTMQHDVLWFSMCWCFSRFLKRDRIFFPRRASQTAGHRWDFGFGLTGPSL